jgi:hypothetical protein
MAHYLVIKLTCHGQNGIFNILRTNLQYQKGMKFGDVVMHQEANSERFLADGLFYALM